ncbi:MAG: ACT domain-containing protein [Tissierellia bacterium]|nr:ACT domain-containing protein [Tissierellia bacterium]
MRAVVTVIGKDQIGIVHRVSGLMVDYKLNIVDISQTILGDYFTMIAIVDISQMEASLDQVSEAYDGLGKEMGLSIRIQHEDIFEKMHQV